MSAAERAIEASKAKKANEGVVRGNESAGEGTSGRVNGPVLNSLFYQFLPKMRRDVNDA